jgi:hypothetical protein
LTQRAYSCRPKGAASRLFRNASVAICWAWLVLVPVANAAEPAKTPAAEPAKTTTAEPAKASPAEAAKPAAEASKSPAAEQPKAAPAEPAAPQGPETPKAPGMERPAAPATEPDKATDGEPARPRPRGPWGPGMMPFGMPGGGQPGSMGPEAGRMWRRPGESGSRQDGQSSFRFEGWGPPREGSSRGTREGGLPSFGPGGPVGPRDERGPSSTSEKSNDDHGSDPFY